MKKSHPRKAKAAATSTTKKQGDTVLVLRICNADMTSSHGFTWPESGHVECPDWRAKAECGNGLHGWLWGEGDHSAANWTDDNRWLVVEVLAADVIDLGGKVKFPAGEVVHCGDQKSATEYLRAHLPAGRSTSIIGATATAGDSGTATAGYSGTATAGYSGTATAGYSGTATAGEGGMIAFKWYGGVAWHIVVGAVGQDGIEKGKPYHIKDGKIVAGEHPEAKAYREYAAKLSAMKPGDRP